MIIVVMTHNFEQENKTFDFLFQAQQWADCNGFVLVPTESPNVYRATF